MKLKAIIALVLIILIFVILYFTITAKAATIAYLNIENGTVEVDKGEGWIKATDEMELNLFDRIRTLNGEAVIILYESILINLEPNTEVALKEISEEYIRVKQYSGVTWNKFTDIIGINELTIETPETVATVRGTEFGVTMDEVIVAEGIVDVQKGDENIEVKAGAKAKIIQGKLKKLNLTQKEKQRIVVKMRKTVKRFERIDRKIAQRQNFIRKQIIALKEKKMPLEKRMQQIPKEKLKARIEKQKQTLQKKIALMNEVKQREKPQERIRENLPDKPREIIKDKISPELIREKPPETIKKLGIPPEVIRERLRIGPDQPLSLEIIKEKLGIPPDQPIGPEKLQEIIARLEKPIEPERIKPQEEEKE